MSAIQAEQVKRTEFVERMGIGKGSFGSYFGPSKMYAVRCAASESYSDRLAEHANKEGVVTLIDDVGEDISVTKIQLADVTDQFGEQRKIIVSEVVYTIDSSGRQSSPPLILTQCVKGGGG